MTCIARIAIAACLLLAASAPGNGGAGDKKTLSEEEARDMAALSRMEERRWVGYRMHANEPVYRDKPARSENISDDEVREIQALMAPFHKTGMVSIGTVVRGCPCEEGSECTDQVWVMVPASPAPRGFLLSRINKLWTFGIGQRWWLDYEQFERTHSWRDADDREMEFPACTKKQIDARKPLALLGIPP